MADRGEYGVAVMFSQDQDLSEVADEVCLIVKEQNRWIKIASVVPWSSAPHNMRGIDKTSRRYIEPETDAACGNPRDYRPKGKPYADPGGHIAKSGPA